MSLAETQPSSPPATRARLPNRTKVVYTIEGIGAAFLVFMAALRIDDRFALGLAAFAAMMGFRFGAWLVQRREQKLGKGDCVNNGVFGSTRRAVARRGGAGHDNT